MKVLKKLFVLCMIGLISIAGNLYSNNQPIQTIYTIFDTNATLLKKVDEYISQVDTLTDLLLPVTWQGTTESYFEQYVQNKFGIQLSDIQLGSQYRYVLVTQYVDENIKKAEAILAKARECVAFRAQFFIAMSDKLSEINSLQDRLLQVRDYAKRYEKFLLGYQILNFYVSLPISDSFNIHNKASFKGYEKVLKVWIDQGFYKNKNFPLIEIAKQFIRDLEWLKALLSEQGNDYAREFPVWYEGLVLLKQKIEFAQYVLMFSEIYKEEKIEYDAYMQELELQQAKEDYEFYKRQVKYYQERARSCAHWAEIYRNDARNYPELASSYLDSAQYYERQVQSAEGDVQYYSNKVREYEEQFINDLQRKVRNLEQKVKKNK